MCHIARRVKKFLVDERIEILIWPTQNLDLNPRESMEDHRGEGHGEKNIQNY